jgi:hypothetical protein
MNTPLIGTGFCAIESDYEAKRRLLDIWLKNTGDHDIVIVDNNEVKPLVVENPKVRVIRINNNLGSFEANQGKFRPHLLGYSVGWIMAALTAYSENRDFLYKEQDCLWFGKALEEIMRRAQVGDMVAQLGYAVTAPCRVESSLFWVRHDFITEFIAKYIEISPGDGVQMVEEKFHAVSKRDDRIVPLGFGVGRDRPMPLDHPVWYVQKITAEEIEMLKEKGLV